MTRNHSYHRIPRRAILAAALALAGATASVPALAQNKTQIRIGGAGAGGLFYVISGGIANLINKYSTTINATVQATSGGVENGRLVESGQVDMALVTEDIADHLWRGVDEYKAPGTNARLLIKGHPTIYTFVTLGKSSIRTLQDVKGKTITFGPPGAGSTVLGERIFAEAGLKLGTDYRAQVMAYAQQNDALRDGRVDVIFNGGLVPIPQLVELNATQDIRLIPIPVALVESIQKKYGRYYEPKAVPANSFKNQPADVPALNIGYSNLIVRAGLADNVVKEIAKILNDHNNELVAVHVAGKFYQPAEAFAGGVTFMPFHNGAIAYLKETGRWDKKPAGVIELK